MVEYGLEGSASSCESATDAVRLPGAAQDTENCVAEALNRPPWDPIRRNIRARVVNDIPAQARSGVQGEPRLVVTVAAIIGIVTDARSFQKIGNFHTVRVRTIVIRIVENDDTSKSVVGVVWKPLSCAE